VLLSDVSRATVVHKGEASPLVEEVVGILEGLGVETESTNKSLEREGFKDSGLIVTLGGDGTVLRGFERSLSMWPPPPVLAFNLGTVGFLADHDPKDVGRVLEWMESHEAYVEYRPTLRVGAGLLEVYQVVNDLVLQRDIRSEMLELEVRVSGELIGPIRADGLIVATATGSTAYSLSAGGPVVMPTSDNITLTPICSRAPGARSIVVPARPIEVTSKKPVAFFVDGEECGESDSFAAWSGARVGLVRTPFMMPYMESLRSKMGWNL
jgi:NAD+ kinase